MKNISEIERGTEYNVYPTIFGRTSLGLGYGPDYGGYGANFTYYPHVNIGLFTGVGGAPAGTGFNAGFKIRFTKSRTMARVIPHFIAMYGSNSAVVVRDAPKYNKLFYGPSFGFGVDVHAAPPTRGSVTIAILCPIRSSDTDVYILKTVEPKQLDYKKQLPLVISIGYRFIFHSK